MHQRRRGNERVTLAALVGNMQPGAALCHSGIDWQRASGELGQYVPLQPRAQYAPLGNVLALDPQNALLQFHDGVGVSLAQLISVQQYPGIRYQSGGGMLACRATLHIICNTSG